MIDASGRNINHLRLSVTNRCNLNCFYCHKEGNHCDSEMSFDQIIEVLRSAKDAGINSVKITGGEPLLREDIAGIISEAVTLGLDISLTTNGLLLKRWARQLTSAGLKRINVGCDTLTSILPKNIDVLMDSIREARAQGIVVKLNMVALKGINDAELGNMIRYCIENSLNLQLIELVKAGNVDDGMYSRCHFPLQEMEASLEHGADIVEQREMQGRKRYHFGRMYIETVIPSHKFCEKCNKIRVAADGTVRQCLMMPEAMKSIAYAIKTRRNYGYG